MIVCVTPAVSGCSVKVLQQQHWTQFLSFDLSLSAGGLYGLAEPTCRSLDMALVWVIASASWCSTFLNYNSPGLAPDLGSGLVFAEELAPGAGTPLGCNQGM